MVGKIFLIILLLSVSISAQTYTVDPSRDSIITFCLYETNTPIAYTDQLTQAKARYLLNKCIGVVCTDFPALEKVDTVVLSADSLGASLNTDFVRAVRIYKIYNNDSGQIVIPLRYVPTDSTWVIYPSEETNFSNPENATAQSSYYTFGRRFYAHPKPQSISAIPDSFVVFYNAIDDKLTSATDSTIISPDYIDELINLTCFEFLKVRGNGEKAASFKEMYLESKKTPKPREADLKR